MPREVRGWFVPKEWEDRHKHQTPICCVCELPRAQWPDKNRFFYCSLKCAEEYRSKILYWSTHRETVFKRDNYTCVKCGNGHAPYNAWRARAEEWFKKNHQKENQAWFVATEYGPKWYEDAYEIITKDMRPVSVDHELQADHIIPVAAGGDMWAMENLQTLCVKCHRKKTVHDLRTIKRYHIDGHRDTLQARLV